MMPQDISYNIYPIGDEGLTIELGEDIDVRTNQRCLLLADHLRSMALPAVRDIVTAYSSVSILYDSVNARSMNKAVSAFHYFEAVAVNAIRNCNWNNTLPQRKLTIPVCYDPSCAPDLERLAQEKNISPDDFIRVHSDQPYRVFMIGFIPGFAYMATVDPRIAAPRLRQPRISVPPGSIGIAGQQTGIYPLASPGGWNIVGRTPLKIFDVNSDQPCLLRAGDEVRFEPLSIGRFHQLNEHA